MTSRNVHLRWSNLPDVPRRGWPATTLVPIQVSTHDRISAGLGACVLISAIAVFVMAGFWMEGSVGHTLPVEFQVFSEAPSTESMFTPASMDWQSLEKGEFPESGAVLLAESLEPTTEAVSNVWAAISGHEGDVGDGRLPAPGKLRQIGPEIPDGFPLSEADRWRVHLSASDRLEYARMLDFFGIEIGVVRKYSNLVECVNDLSSETPRRTEKLRRDESRLFFISSQSRLRAWDESMGRRAGIDMTDSLTGHFFPQVLRERLLALERAAVVAQGRALEEVRETRFGVRATGEGFEHFVAEVIYMR